MFFHTKLFKNNKPKYLKSIKNDKSDLNHFSKKSFWYETKLWILPYLKENEKLTKEYLIAKIKQEQNIANKIEAQANLLKMKEIREFNSIINEIFSDDGLPEEAKALKLAKVLENNNIKSLLNSTQKIITNQQH